MADQNATDSSNSTEEFPCPAGADSRPEVWVRAALYVVTMLVSLLGNASVLWFVRHTPRRSNSNTFVANLSAADLVMTLLTMPAVLVEISTDTDVGFAGWPGDLVCKLLYFFQDFALYASILTLVGIALDRFLAVTLPLRQIMTPRRVKFALAVIWAAAFVTSAPLLYANKVYADGPWVFCVEDWSPLLDPLTAPRSYTIVLFSLLYVAPVLLISALYSALVYKLWRRAVPGNASQTGQRIRARARHRALKMTATIIACFTLSWLPYHVVSFLSYFHSAYYDCGLPIRLWFAGTFLGHLSSAANPVIFAAFNREYRNAVRGALRVCSRGNRVGDVGTCQDPSGENITMKASTHRLYARIETRAAYSNETAL